MQNPKDEPVAPASAGLAGDAARHPPGYLRAMAAAVPCWVAAAVAISNPGLGKWLAILSALAGVALLAIPAGVRLSGSLRRARQPARLRRSSASPGLRPLALLVLAALVLVGARVTELEMIRSDPVLSEAAARGEQIEVLVRLTSFPEQRSSQGELRRWVRASAPDYRDVPLILWLDEHAQLPTNAGPGLVMRATMKLTPLPPADSAAFSANTSKIDLLAHSTANPIVRLHLIAAAFRGALTDAAQHVDHAALVPGFAVGDTSLVSDDLDAAMRDTALTHLTAVSGSNIGLVVAVVVACLSRLGVRRRWRVAGAGAAILVFSALVGPDASLQRAAVMAAVLLLGRFGGQRATGLASLGTAMVVLLALDPWQAMQPGFALSVAATAGILFLAAPLTRLLRHRARFPRVLALPVAVATAAQLTCGPLTLLLQPGVPVLGVIANVLAAPAAPLGTGLGLLAMLLLPVSDAMGHWVLSVASLPAHWIELIAYSAERLPIVRLHWPGGWTGAVLHAACELALLVAWWVRRGTLALPGIGRVTPRRPWQPETSPPLAVRVVVAVLRAGALGIVVGCSFLTPTIERLAVPDDWFLVACDVGQGDAILLRDPDEPDRVVLIDTGDSVEMLESCLDTFSVSRLALLLLSHDDRDHVGALAAVLGRTERAVIAPESSEHTARREALLEQFSTASVPVEVGHAGMSMAFSREGLRLEILAPEPGVTPVDANAASLVARAEVDDTSILLLADTGYEEQSRLRLGGTHLQADVLKVAHHGSKDQDPALAPATGAQIALISVGADNRYGHPADDTLAQLARAGMAVLRTDAHGSVALSADADGISAWSERALRRVPARQGSRAG